LWEDSVASSTIVYEEEDSYEGDFAEQDGEKESAESSSSSMGSTIFTILLVYPLLLMLLFFSAFLLVDAHRRRQAEWKLVKRQQKKEEVENKSSVHRQLRKGTISRLRFSARREEEDVIVAEDYDGQFEDGPADPLYGHTNPYEHTDMYECTDDEEDEKMAEFLHSFHDPMDPAETVQQHNTPLAVRRRRSINTASTTMTAIDSQSGQRRLSDSAVAFRRPSTQIQALGDAADHKTANDDDDDAKRERRQMLVDIAGDLLALFGFPLGRDILMKLR
jgi:hypothetical protein